MTDKPILFSGPMVRALLDGRKTQTRRVVKPGLMAAPYNMTATDKGIPESIDDWGVVHYRPLRFQPGDRLYVREHWCTGGQFDHAAPRDLIPEQAAPIGFIADEPEGTISRTGKFRQGMHMPRWASRLTLHVTEVRVQRLQDISAADAIAEGIPPCDTMDPRTDFRSLWESINGDESWAANPWVVAISFDVEHANIDSARKA